MEKKKIVYRSGVGFAIQNYQIQMARGVDLADPDLVDPDLADSDLAESDLHCKKWRIFFVNTYSSNLKTKISLKTSTF